MITADNELPALWQADGLFPMASSVAQTPFVKKKEEGEQVRKLILSLWAPRTPTDIRDSFEYSASLKIKGN